MTEMPREDEQRPPGMPGWVKAFIAVVVLIVLLFLGSMLLGVKHGPGRHADAGVSAAAQQTEVR